MDFSDEKKWAHCVDSCTITAGALHCSKGQGWDQRHPTTLQWRLTIFSRCHRHMEGAMNHLKQELGSMRSGRASPGQCRLHLVSAVAQGRRSVPSPYKLLQQPQMEVTVRVDLGGHQMQCWRSIAGHSGGVPAG